MDNNPKHKLVPTQEQGVQKDFKHDYIANSIDDASELFIKAKNRLLDINNWKEYSAAFSATFKLTDNQGQEVHRSAHAGDYIKIDIPGPGSSTGDGFDWVHIEAIEYEDYPDEDYETIALKVRPASNPTSQNDDTAHFFKNAATSTFVIARRGRHLVSHYHGRNEVANTETPLLDTTRNLAISVGAWVGGSDAQWKSLITGLIDFKDD